MKALPMLFALLEHETADGVHWDLLVEQPGASLLATWRLARNPLEHTGLIAGERIADHRRLYLDYEGPVSGDRGTVRRLARGNVEWLPAEQGGLGASPVSKGPSQTAVPTARLRFTNTPLAGVWEIRPQPAGGAVLVRCE